MQWLWTWAGVSFGYRDGDHLWTHDGKHVGSFVGDVVYGRDARYLGEIRGGNRLIADRARKAMTSGSPPFEPLARRTPQMRRVNSGSIAMPAGYEDFPAPERFGGS